MKIRFLLDAPPLSASERRAGAHQYKSGEVAEVPEAEAKALVRDGYAEAIQTLKGK